MEHESSAEAFLDQLVTWREVGYNFSAHRGDYDRYESLPPWAQKTLEEHARDERAHLYSLEEFESGSTHDVLWNAAQGQLRQDGHIHNYMRMLWGKKILEWSRFTSGGPGHSDRAQQQVWPRWPQPQFVQRHFLVPGALRPALGSDAPDLWNGPLHELGKYRA